MECAHFSIHIDILIYLLSLSIKNSELSAENAQAHVRRLHACFKCLQLRSIVSLGIKNIQPSGHKRQAVLYVIADPRACWLFGLAYGEEFLKAWYAGTPFPPNDLGNVP